MNNLKVTIDVNVNLSKETIAAFASLFAGCSNGNPLSTKVEETKVEEVKAEPVKEVKAEPVKEVKAELAKEVKAELAKEVKAEETKPARTIDDLRLLARDVINKGDSYRTKVKEYLTSIGVAKITALAPEQYDACYDFLNSL